MTTATAPAFACASKATPRAAMPMAWPPFAWSLTSTGAASAQAPKNAATANAVAMIENLVSYSQFPLLSPDKRPPQKRFRQAWQPNGAGQDFKAGAGF